MVAEFYEQKLFLFHELNQVTDQMLKFSVAELVNDDNTEERFAELLTKRAELMQQIDELDAQFKGSSVEENPWREKLQAEMIKLQGKNERLEQVVQGSLQHLRQEARKLKEGKQSQKAYLGRVASSEGAFIDKRR